MPLQMTYIPAQYWSAPQINFSILSKGPTPPKESGFFFLWMTENVNELILNQQITRIFPQVPVEKLLFAQLRMVTIEREEKSSNNGEKGEKGEKDSSNHKLLPVREIQGKIMPIPPAIKLLFALDLKENPDRTRHHNVISDSIRTFALLTKFTFEVLHRGNFVPVLEPLDEKRFEGKWQILLKTQLDHYRFKLILQNAAWSAYNLASDFCALQDANVCTSGVWHPAYVFNLYMNRVADFLIRTTLNQGFNQDFENKFGVSLDSSCSLDSKTSWDLRFLRACLNKSRIFEIQKFCDTPIPNILRNWVQNSQSFSFDLGISFTFRLESPRMGETDWLLAFYLQPISDSKIFYPLRDLWDGNLSRKQEFANACEDTSDSLQETVLRALGTAAKLFPPIARALEMKNPQFAKIDTQEVMEFLRTSQYLLIQSGFNIILPEEFTDKGQQRLSAQLVIQPVTPTKRKRTTGGSNPVPTFDLSSVLEYHWESRLGDQVLTDKEFSALADTKEPLIKYQNQWVLVDPQDMDTLKTIFENKNESKFGMAVRGELSYFEALKLGMLGEVQLKENGTKFEVKLQGDFSNVIMELAHLDKFEDVLPSNAFQGKLRPYQQKGLTWLANMARFNFGICLADDMGLGKTVQIIAFLLYRKEILPKETGSILIICPTSVLFNWHREIQKFAPTLEFVEHYGPQRVKDVNGLTKLLQPHRIILTTYGTIRNDIELLETLHFQGIIVDESQNIKNYKTHQTKSIYRLKAQYRIALSGTPIENRMLELWTLFEFLNPGLLGSRTEFQTKYILPIERFHDMDTTSKLQKVISPFILRRLKTDTTIIQDLPPKNEIKIYIDLSDQQKQLYQQVVKTTMQEIESAKQDLFKRKGLVLRLLMQLKQIANHPYQFLHLNLDQPLNSKEEDLEEALESREEQLEDAQVQKNIHEVNTVQMEEFISQSQKLERLLDMIEEVLERGEKLIIFSQFKQMGALLQKILERKYEFPVLFFHGGLSENQRRTIVDEFQSKELDSSPILILSLRAGGTGLNLTQAKVVFHYDRWWNPAVEDQATDRAYRIGQTQQVNVYKFIAASTIEEKIDAMLNEKRNLADKILHGAGETWITDLSDAELRELFSLK